MTISFRTRRLVAPLLAAILSAGASAAPAADSTASDAPRDWYQVEVIIFHQSDDANIHSSEVWPTNPPPPDFSDFAALRPADSGTKGSLVPFQEVPPSERQLGGAEATLERSSVYKPLLHVAWRQPGYPQDQAPAVRIPIETLPLGMSPSADSGTTSQPPASGDNTAPPQGQPDNAAPLPQLSGYMRVYRERYLHFQVNLRYRPDAAADTDQGYQYNSEGYFEAAKPVVVMKQHRRMRSGELHYLDNPALGVLVKIIPIQAPAGQAAPGQEDPGDSKGATPKKTSDQGRDGAQ